MTIDFIGIGAQKAATSWLFKVLQEHPEVCVPPEKEIHFFDRHFENGVEWYESKFSGCRAGTVRGEISPSYLSDPHSLERIFEFNPRVKIIVNLRDPRYRALSHVNHLISKKRLEGETGIEAAVEKFPGIIENGLYGKHLKRYLERFPREQLLILFYRDIQEDPGAIVQRVYSFLGISEDVAPTSLKRRYNTSAFRLSFLHRVVNKVYFFFLKRAWGRRFLRLLKRFGISATLISGIVSKLRPSPKSSSADIEYLNQFFRGDIAELERLVGPVPESWKAYA